MNRVNSDMLNNVADHGELPSWVIRRHFARSYLKRLLTPKRNRQALLRNRLHVRMHRHGGAINAAFAASSGGLAKCNETNENE